MQRPLLESSSSPVRESFAFFFFVRRLRTSPLLMNLLLLATPLLPQVLQLRDYTGSDCICGFWLHRGE